MNILAAYEHLRDSGFIELPHRTTLNQYTSFTSSGTGFNPDIIKRFCEDLEIEKLKKYEKQTNLLFDEIKIKSGLVYSKSSGRVVGFTEMGDINEELDQFDREFEQDVPKTKELATYVLAFMARGLLKRFQYPIGYFSSRGFTSDQLFPVAWRAIRILESIGLEVVSVVCDGASPNRRFFKLHALDEGLNTSIDGVVYWVPNRYDPSRKVFFISDPPHLIKTLRNNLENSHSHNHTKNLMVSVIYSFVSVKIKTFSTMF